MPWLCPELWQGLDNMVLVQRMAGQPRTGRKDWAGHRQGSKGRVSCGGMASSTGILAAVGADLALAGAGWLLQSLMKGRSRDLQPDKKDQAFSRDAACLFSDPLHTCSEVDHRGCASSDSIHLGMDLML